MVVFVYTSVDRQGDKSDSNPTFVPHFASKHEVELYLKEKAEGKMTWTILRPTAFMDGITPDFMGKALATFMKIGIKPSKKLAYIATSDIGFFAAQAFLQPESPDYKKKAISLAGDELTYEELQQVFKEKQGYDLPTTYEFFARFMKRMLTEINVMFRWFDEVGYAVDIPKLKKMNPGLMDFGKWLEKEGGFPVKK